MDESLSDSLRTRAEERVCSSCGSDDTDLVVVAIRKIQTELNSVEMTDSAREAVMAAIRKVLGGGM
jgi:hypothetical protein